MPTINTYVSNDEYVHYLKNREIFNNQFKKIIQDSNRGDSSDE